jgi:hypothetical protein
MAVDSVRGTLLQWLRESAPLYSLDNEPWTMLGFGVDLGNVFAENTSTQQLHAAYSNPRKESRVGNVSIQLI